MFASGRKQTSMMADEKLPVRFLIASSQQVAQNREEYEKNQLHHHYGNIASVYNRRVQ